MKKQSLYVIAFSLIIIFICIYLIYITVDTVQYTLANETTTQEVSVVIDAGHGGVDGGAVGYDGTSEKAINLSISYYLNDILNSFGVNTIMTRTDDNSIHDSKATTIREQKVSDIHNRMKIMEDTPNCIFVSIHLNSFSNSTLSGTQVFYSPNTTASPEIADCVQSTVHDLLQPTNNRIIKKSGNSIYLLYYAKKPAILVECGFITNKTELEQMKTDEYQKQLAFAIACGILQYMSK